MNFRHATVVYQGLRANVIAHQGAACIVLLKGDFHECESFARGLQAAGVTIHNKWLDQPGDIAEEIWHKNLEAAPFFNLFNPVTPLKNPI